MKGFKHKTITTKSGKETEKLGGEFANNIKKGDIIFLYGDLGSGKTTFIKGVAKGFGILERIISPTFVFIREHAITDHELRIKKLYHIDLYRAENERDLRSLGLGEIFSEKNAVTLVEWAERLGDNLPKERWDIKFGFVDEKNREISFEKIQNSKIKNQK